MLLLNARRFAYRSFLSLPQRSNNGQYTVVLQVPALTTPTLSLANVGSRVLRVLLARRDLLDTFGTNSNFRGLSTAALVFTVFLDTVNKYHGITYGSR